MKLTILEDEKYGYKKIVNIDKNEINEFYKKVYWELGGGKKRKEVKVKKSEEYPEAQWMEDVYYSDIVKF